MALPHGADVNTSTADLKVAGIFAEGMVIQRGIKVPVWGRGSPGAKVAVEFEGQRQAATVAADGKWRLTLAPLKASSAGSASRSVLAKTLLFSKMFLPVMSGSALGNRTYKRSHRIR